MRFAFARGTPAERESVRRRLEALLEPRAALALLRRLPGGARPVDARCSVLRGAKDRYVVRVDAQAADGSDSAYVLKGYADERGVGIGNLYDGLERYWRRHGGLSPAIAPLCYLPEERLFVLPWIDGVSLAEAIAAGRLEIVREAAQQVPRTLARLHATPIVPEAPTDASTMVGVTIARWERHYRRFPETRAVVEPLMRALEAACARLAPARPALIHGDTGPGNFLYDGARWRLLDLDTYGYADPAYDVGYLLAKLENHCRAQQALRAHAGELVAAMRRACLEAMPDAAARNAGFYYALTLARKTLPQILRALQRGRIAEFPEAAAPVVQRIRDALDA